MPSTDQTSVRGPDPSLKKHFPEFEWVGVPTVAIGKHPDFTVEVSRYAPQRFRACLGPDPYSPYGGYVAMGATAAKAVAAAFAQLDNEVNSFLALQKSAGDFKDRGEP